MDRKPNMGELFVLGPSKARLALSRVARQRVVGQKVRTTTTDSRSGWPQETVGERKNLDCCQSRPEFWFHVWSCAFLRFFFLAVSRPDSGNCHGRDGEVYRQHLTVRSHAHFFFAAHATCDYTFGSKAWRFSVCLEKSFHLWSCLCWRFLPYHRLLPHRRHWLESD